MAVAVENNFTVEAGGKEIESFILPTTESFVTFMAKKLIDAFAKLLSFWKAVNTLSKFACEKTRGQKKEKKSSGHMSTLQLQQLRSRRIYFFLVNEAIKIKLLF